jgi:D-alanyl-D-alanine dipeptidase
MRNTRPHRRVVTRAEKKRRRILLVLLPLLLVLGLWRLVSPPGNAGIAGPSAATGDASTGAATDATTGDASAAASATPAIPANGVAAMETVGTTVDTPAASAAVTATSVPATTAAPTPTTPSKPTAAPVPTTTFKPTGEAAPTTAPDPTTAPEQTSTPAPAPLTGTLPEGFVELQVVHPDIRVDMRYLGSNNFMGRPADGYLANRAILTEKAAAALETVQDKMMAQGLGLVVYDAYRPERAVLDFVHWGEDLQDQKMKPDFYPDIPKEDILAKGFLARRSSHSRGSTVDLTLIDLVTGNPLDMGTPFDWFGPEADPDYPDLTAEQLANRKLLGSAMDEAGFAISTIEWWHFRLRDEPFPKTYFDFPVQ